jgi:hypothetical protein
MASAVPPEVICAGHPEYCNNGQLQLPPGKQAEDVLSLDELACDSRTSVCTYDLTTHENTVNCRMIINGQEVRLERRCDSFKVADVSKDGTVGFSFSAAVWDLLTHRGMFVKSMSGRTYSLLLNEDAVRPDNQQMYRRLDPQRRYFGNSPPADLLNAYGSALVTFQLVDSNSDTKKSLLEEFATKRTQQGKQTVDMQMITYYLVNNARNIANFASRQTVQLTQHLTLAQGWKGMTSRAMTVWFDILYDNTNAVSISEIALLDINPAAQYSPVAQKSPAATASPVAAQMPTCATLARVFVPDYKVQTQTYSLDHDKYYCVILDAGCVHGEKMNVTFFAKFGVRTFVCTTLTDSGIRLATHDAEDSQCFYSTRNCKARIFGGVTDMSMNVSTQNYVRMTQVAVGWGDGRCDPMVIE